MLSLDMYFAFSLGVESSRSTVPIRNHDHLLRNDNPLLRPTGICCRKYLSSNCFIDNSCDSSQVPESDQAFLQRITQSGLLSFEHLGLDCEICLFIRKWCRYSNYGITCWNTCIRTFFFFNLFRILVCQTIKYGHRKLFTDLIMI